MFPHNVSHLLKTFLGFSCNPPKILQKLILNFKIFSSKFSYLFLKFFLTKNKQFYGVTQIPILFPNSCSIISILIIQKSKFDLFVFVPPTQCCQMCGFVNTCADFEKFPHTVRKFLQILIFVRNCADFQ